MPPKTRQNKPQKSLSRNSAAGQAMRAKSTWTIAAEKKATADSYFAELRKCVCGCYIKLNPELIQKRSRNLEEISADPDKWRHLDVEKASKYGPHLVEFAENESETDS